MPKLQLIIRRGAKEIGGTIVELKTDKTKLLLDIGKPLTINCKDIDVAAFKPDAVLISHPHQDHYGLIDQLDKWVPVYIGELGKDLILASRKFLGRELPSNDFRHFSKWEPFIIGDFKITPYLMDHSAVDSYAFLIEAEGKRLFYSGDFRDSGNKSFLFKRLLDDPPQGVDVLLMEGTMMRRSSDKFPDEASVSGEIESVLRKQQNITFLIASSQNIDRIVSAAHACRNTDKILVLDIYTAWVLEKVGRISGKVPTMDWDWVGIYADHNMDKAVKGDLEFFGDFRNRLYRYRITKDEMMSDPCRYLCFSKMSRFKIMEIYKKFGPVNLIYSQWLGYLKCTNDDYYGAEQINTFQSDPKVRFTYAHTSGHATVKSLIKLNETLNPDMLVPIHTEFPEDYNIHFKKVTTLADGEVFEIY